ncbi:sterol desaturase family protein [Aquimarina sp. 2201CG5-10]|uniref:sterol desaturase family protein n=1 Tax=Aquimarina callyspongiae TaxID=3098150 RepID=UPI002AB4A734|nr:sterol desaturase family protein [Aquimarina sp. 2201CG5-10]MDY8137990.1 sterol desaturase family protein [Aquimarina sp. 2201CG5-10]
MNYTRLLVYSIVIIGTIVGIPHFVVENFNLEILDPYSVEYFFYIFNDLSIFYIIIPFFIIELARYLYLKRLNKNIVLDSVSNVITLFAFIGIEYILGILFVLKLYTIASEFTIFPELPLNWITISCCILLADFLYYWEHRLMHRIGAGWATHTVHHSSPHFNMSVAYRFGPLDSVFPLFFSIPAVLLGFNPYLLLASEIFVQTFQAILHTEIIGKLPKPLEFIFNTPSHHRVHHGSNKQYWDKNYGGIFIIWDRILGTFEPEKEKVIYGISEPLNSVNPIKVFFHGLSRLYHKIKTIKGFRNKLLAFVKPPDWIPAEKTNNKI